MLHAWIKNSQRLPNISWRILRSKQRVHRSLMPNEHPVSMKGPITITPPAPLDHASLFYINRRNWGGVQRLNEAQWTSWNVVSIGFVQSLEFLKQSWNFPSNFQDLKKVCKREIKSEKMVKKSWVFSPVLLLQSIMKKSFVPLLITYSITLSLEKEIIVVEKSLESKNLYERCINAN